MIFNLPNDDTRKVIAVALSLCLVCALLVSTAAVYLRPLQEINKTLDMKKNILDVAGLLQPGTDINKTFAARIEIRAVDFSTGAVYRCGRSHGLRSKSGLARSCHE